MNPSVIDKSMATKRVMDLMAIRGRSGFERDAVEWVRRQLMAAGAKKSQISLDQAHKRSPHMGKGGHCGNLVFKLPGTVRAPRRMLMAHIDTVSICEGSKPVRRGGKIVSADRSTALGADDRAGCAVILTAALELMKHSLPHPPLTFLWTIQEEVGLYGARFGKLGVLGRPKMAFNWDSDEPDRVIIGATGAYSMDIDIRGVASHAGCAPEQGVSAAVIFALAAADLKKNGWHGLVMKNGERGTSNMGVLNGGDATNVVMDHLKVRAEARAHNPKLRAKIVTAYRQAFERAARSVKSSLGVCGRARLRAETQYEAFLLDSNDPAVLAADQAIRSVGMEPRQEVATGGLDANWLTARGLSAVTLGAGMRDVHTRNESLVVREYLAACQVALRLATASAAEPGEGS